jgi:hypothetical protein
MEISRKDRSMSIFEQQTLQALDDLIQSGYKIVEKRKSDEENAKEVITEMASIYTVKVCQENQENLKAIGNFYLKQARDMMETAIEDGLAIKEKTGEHCVKEHMRAQFQITWGKINQS